MASATARVINIKRRKPANAKPRHGVKHYLDRAEHADVDVTERELALATEVGRVGVAGGNSRRDRLQRQHAHARVRGVYRALPPRDAPEVSAFSRRAPRGG